MDAMSVLTALLLIVASAQFVPRSVAQSPSVSDHCAGVDCQQGTCNSEVLLYSCKCNEGWENILDLPWAACGIPKDCHINYTCSGDGGAAPPSPPPFSVFNLTKLNPCTYSVCGFGKCVAKEDPGLLAVPYSCTCDPGNSNALNTSSGICLPNCNFGGSCQNLGLTLSNSTSDQGSTITTPSSAGKTSNEVATLLASATVGAAVWLWM